MRIAFAILVLALMSMQRGEASCESDPPPPLPYTQSVVPNFNFGELSEPELMRLLPPHIAFKSRWHGDYYPAVEAFCLENMNAACRASISTAMRKLCGYIVTAENRYEIFRQISRLPEDARDHIVRCVEMCLPCPSYDSGALSWSLSEISRIKDPQERERLCGVACLLKQKLDVPVCRGIPLVARVLQDRCAQVIECMSHLVDGMRNDDFQYLDFIGTTFPLVSPLSDFEMRRLQAIFQKRHGALDLEAHDNWGSYGKFVPHHSFICETVQTFEKARKLSLETVPPQPKMPIQRGGNDPSISMNLDSSDVHCPYKVFGGGRCGYGFFVMLPYSVKNEVCAILFANGLYDGLLALASFLPNHGLLNEGTSDVRGLIKNALTKRVEDNEKFASLYPFLLTKPLRLQTMLWTYKLLEPGQKSFLEMFIFERISENTMCYALRNSYREQLLCLASKFFHMDRWNVHSQRDVLAEIWGTNRPLWKMEGLFDTIAAILEKNHNTFLIRSALMSTEALAKYELVKVPKRLNGEPDPVGLAVYRRTLWNGH